MTIARAVVVPPIICALVVSICVIYYSRRPSLMKTSRKLGAFQSDIEEADSLIYNIGEVTPTDVVVQQSALTLKRSRVPLQHIAFIKTHKCASSTVQTILLRYGLANKLTFVRPKGSAYNLGWPDSFDAVKHARPLSGAPDMFCHHSVFSSGVSEIMPADTFYLTIVRDPFSQIRSTYVYYNLYKRSRKQTLSQVVGNSSNRKWIGNTRVYNPMIYDLGLPMSTTINQSEVQRYILDVLDKRFDLVIVVEYFRESLIILRDMLGWTNRDVLYFASNFRADKSGTVKSYPGVDINGTAEGRRQVYNSSFADTKLYLHFKKKLELILEANKSYIDGEIVKLERLREQWMDYCIKQTVPMDEIADPRFRQWGYNLCGYLLTRDGLHNQTCLDLAMTATQIFTTRMKNHETKKQ